MKILQYSLLQHALKRMEERRIKQHWIQAVLESPERMEKISGEAEIMKIDYEKEVAALYIQLLDEPVEESKEIRDGIILDYTKDKEVRGIEVLNITKQLHILASLEELSASKNAFVLCYHF